MKRIVVCGAGGFIGGHLVKRLKADGHFVRGIDRKRPEFALSEADEFVLFDLRRLKQGDVLFDGIDECYQLACEVGGLGYIMDKNNDAEMLGNSMRINLNVLDACRWMLVRQIFFASSACVYPTLGDSEGCRESDAYPADPDNEYAWEKLFAERLYDAYARNHGIEVRIGRFHNCYGPFGTWQGGREKAPAAICRKIAAVESGGSVEIWGDGRQTRSFMYVDDAVEGAVRLMKSDFSGPVNIGSSEMVTLDELVRDVARVAGKEINISHIPGLEGVRGRSSDNTLIREKLGWAPMTSLGDGLARTYPWIKQQVDSALAKV